MLSQSILASSNGVTKTQNENYSHGRHPVENAKIVSSSSVKIVCYASSNNTIDQNGTGTSALQSYDDIVRVKLTASQILSATLSKLNRQRCIGVSSMCNRDI